MDSQELAEWIYANSGPILRYRTAVDLMDITPDQRVRLRREAVETAEVLRWLNYLNLASGVHGSLETHAENSLAKLLDYGIDRTLPAFDEAVQRLLERPLQMWDPFVLMPFLLRAGYGDYTRVMEWFSDRFERLYQTARQGNFDFYLPPEEASRVPKAWRGKPIYRDQFGHLSEYALPTCYDLYALAHTPIIPWIPDYADKRETIAAFISDPRFQGTVGGYGWDKDHRRCYAAGRVFLACAEPARLLLFLDMGSRLRSATTSEWFRKGCAQLERYRTTRGTYRFPSSLLQEKSGYYLYSGSHMGLGENRKSPIGVELESTFRMLSIQKRFRN